MKVLNLIGFVVLFLISCSNEGSSIDNNSDVSISGYKITSESDYFDSNEMDGKLITIGEVYNNKIISETTEYFQDGISFGSNVPYMQYFYEGSLLTSVVKNGNSTEVEDMDTKYFFYDDNQNLVGINWNFGGGTSYYRFIHVSSTMVYFEKITLPYNDSSAQIQHRNIIEFDLDDNVIKAGRDYELDGVIDNEFQYSYLDGNLISVQKPNSTILTFEYSNVIDNFSVLKENSYGKKVLCLLNSEHYANYFENDYNNQSRNLLTIDLMNETYEVLSNNYYKKKTLIQDLYDSTIHNVIITEFFFN